MAIITKPGTKVPYTYAELEEKLKVVLADDYVQWRGKNGKLVCRQRSCPSLVLNMFKSFPITGLEVLTKPHWKWYKDEWATLQKNKCNWCYEPS